MSSKSNEIYEKIKNLIYEYLEKLHETIENFGRGVNLLSTMRTGEAMTIFTECMKKEKDADIIRREIVDLLESASTTIPPEEREDLFHLIKRLDAIPDWIKEAVRILTIIPYLEVPAELREGFETLIRLDIETADMLCLAARALFEEDYKRASDLAEKVEELEEKADEADINNRRMLMKYSNKITPIGLVVLLDDFNHALEEVADACEDAADYIRAIAIRKM